MSRAPPILAALAAVMGAAGVALAAAAVHWNGGELAQRGALFLLLHAAATLAIAAHAGAERRTLLIAGFAMEAGASLFAADLGFHAVMGERIFPFAAPIGGTTMLLSWLALAAAFAGDALRPKAAAGARR